MVAEGIEGLLTFVKGVLVLANKFLEAAQAVVTKMEEGIAGILQGAKDKIKIFFNKLNLT